tara:strand:+ start:8558 stop:9973 length:1416 start_codon:yes stop_codon:yes gene_type:complete
MIETITQTKPFKLWAALALLLVAVVIQTSPASPVCRALGASDINLPEYCYRLDLTVTNNATSPTPDNYPVRFEVPTSSMIANNQIDPRGWDVKPTQGGFGNETDLFITDINTNSSSWWLSFDAIPAGESRVARVYIGNPEQKRNQGLSFTTNETVTAATNSAYSIFDDLKIDVEIERLSSLGETAPLVALHSGSSGYSIGFNDNGGTLDLIARANNSSCSVAWDSNHTDINKLITYRFNAAAGNDLFIDIDGSNVAACNTGETSLAIPIEPLQIGTGLGDTIIREIDIYDAGSRVGAWGFDPNATSQTSTSPSFAGTISDYSPTANPLSWSRDIPQTYFETETAGLVFADASGHALFNNPTVDINTTQFGENLFAANNENTNAFGYELFNASLSNLGIPRAMGYAIFLSSIGMIFAIGVFMGTRSVSLAIFAAAVPLTYGSSAGWLPMWWIVIWVMLFVTAYGAWQWGESN